MISIRNEAEIEKLRKSARILVKTFEKIENTICAGTTTQDLDRIAEETILSNGAKPAFKGYHGYPATICTSVNDQVVHGIPAAVKLKDGDILSVDIGVVLNGYFSDAAKTYTIGTVSDSNRKLLRVTREALYKGIEQCCKGNYLSDISNAIQVHVEKHNFSVVRALVGHGIGTALHEEPQIPNYGKPGNGPKLKSGMVFALEPMVNEGGPEVNILEDGWTVQTRDKSSSAHFEHMIVIRNSEPEVLTIEIDEELGRKNA